MHSFKPKNHSSVSPYLLVNNVRRQITFLQSSFGATEIYTMQLPDGTIKHAEVQLDDSVLMLGERPGEYTSICCSTHVYVPDVDACYKAALEAGALSIAEPKDQSYGERSAGVKDAEGNIWWLGTKL